MSATKNQPAFDRMMEEARLRDECSYERYAEELRRNRMKGDKPKKDKPAERHNTKTAERH